MSRIVTLERVETSRLRGLSSSRNRSSTNQGAGFEESKTCNCEIFLEKRSIKIFGV